MKSHHIIIGGGFYGCALGLFLNSAGHKVTIIEQNDAPMGMASYVNQARVHTGFHYPRSVLTAAAAMSLHTRFKKDFPSCIMADFQMLYAIAKRGSKISADRFYKMFEAMKAPIKLAQPQAAALFNNDLIEATFEVEETAFNSAILKAIMLENLAKSTVEIAFNEKVEKIITNVENPAVKLVSGKTLHGDFIYNVTYAGLNKIIKASELDQLNIKHERAEVCLITPPKPLIPYGITVMDGPFFSTMPFPDKKAYSLTHVRHTPRVTWTQEETAWSDETGRENSRYDWMIRDSARFLPCLRDAQYKESLYTTKVVLLRNERDDGRPILFQPLNQNNNVYAVLGGKIDNIYDLFDTIKETIPGCEACTTHNVVEQKQ